MGLSVNRCVPQRKSSYVTHLAATVNVFAATPLYGMVLWNYWINPYMVLAVVAGGMSLIVNPGCTYVFANKGIAKTITPL